MTNISITKKGVIVKIYIILFYKLKMMNNKMDIVNIYNSDLESERTMETMVNNFANWYDWDPTEDQVISFEKDRIETIKQNYVKSFKLRDIEKRTRELVSSDSEIQKIMNDARHYGKEQFRKFDDKALIDYKISVARVISRNFLDKDIIETELRHGVVDYDANREKFIKEYSWTINYKTLVISLSGMIQNLRDMVDSLEQHWSDKLSKSYIEEKKQYFLSYSIMVKKQIDKVEDEKIQGKLLNLYNELSILIGYLLELLN